MAPQKFVSAGFLTSEQGKKILKNFFFLNFEKFCIFGPGIRVRSVSQLNKIMYVPYGPKNCHLPDFNQIPINSTFMARVGPYGQYVAGKSTENYVDKKSTWFHSPHPYPRLCPIHRTR